MSTSITIGLPDEVRDELGARAALSGRTVEDYVRDELIALASRPSAAVWMARVRARKDALQSQAGSAAPCTGETMTSAHAIAIAASGASEARGSAEGRAPGSEPRATHAPLVESRRDVG